MQVKMNIIVIGAGAIGGLYGAKLSLFNDVFLVCRKDHADAINKDGLKINGLEKSVYKLKAGTGISTIDENTIILLTTKVYDSKEAINAIKNLVKPDTIIISLQNGLYSENIVKEVIEGKCTVIRAITNFGAYYLEPGSINYNGKSYTALEDSHQSIELAENFSRCGLNAYVSKNIKEEMWKKLIFNCVLNPLTSILRTENNYISSENLNPLKKLIVDECLRVAEKDGIYFNMDFVGEINTVFRNSKNISSMQQDLIKGKRTEIDYLNGAVVELGKKYGINCPVNNSISVLIKELEKN